eukprot:2789766-Rhodomonas_salina.4
MYLLLNYAPARTAASGRTLEALRYGGPWLQYHMLSWYWTWAVVCLVLGVGIRRVGESTSGRADEYQGSIVCFEEVVPTRPGQRSKVKGPMSNVQCPRSKVKGQRSNEWEGVSVPVLGALEAVVHSWYDVDSHYDETLAGASLYRRAVSQTHCAPGRNSIPDVSTGHRVGSA